MMKEEEYYDYMQNWNQVYFFLRLQLFAWEAMCREKYLG